VCVCVCVCACACVFIFTDRNKTTVDDAGVRDARDLLKPPRRSVCCSVTQYVAVCCSAFQYVTNIKVCTRPVHHI